MKHSRVFRLASIAVIALFAWLIGMDMEGTVAQSTDYDTDDNGLIEISNLEQLDAIRYDTNGDGAADIAGNTTVYTQPFPGISHMTGCPSDGCKGYELTRSLDFDDTSSYASGAVNSHWTTGSGWHSIDEYNAIFEGSEHTISNLFSKRDGLFRSTESSAEIRNLGMIDVEIVSGYDYVGGLVGDNKGSIIASYTSGSISASRSGSGSNSLHAGGLVGHNSGSIIISYASVSVSISPVKLPFEQTAGGLVAGNKGSITASYATGNISSSRNAGGLVGQNYDGGSVTTSYATGDVTGKVSVGGLIAFMNKSSVTASYATGSVFSNLHSGGLVGILYEGGSIDACYAAGSVSGGTYTGELVGYNHGRGPITNSRVITIEDVQTPTGYIGLYKSWYIDIDNADGDDDLHTGADDVWDFGTSSQYPTLKTSEKKPATPPAPTSTPSVDYDTDDDGLIEISNLEQLDAIRYDTNGDGTAENDNPNYAQAFTGIAQGGAGCTSGCMGYELERNLDFNDTSSYASGAVNIAFTKDDGWNPIEGYDAILEGNGHTISNLYSRRSGLFESILKNAQIRRLGMSDVLIPSGRDAVGGLVGIIDGGSVADSYITGSVYGNESVGGLVGIIYGGSVADSYIIGSVYGNESVGGLVGAAHGGSVDTSYAICDVHGNESVGGLVGRNGYFSSVAASYSTGSVYGNEYVGGLVGDNDGAIVASYAIDSVYDNEYGGGLIGDNNGSVEISSYWNTETGRQTSGVGSGSSDRIHGRVTVQMQSPVGYTDLYELWRIDIDNADGDNDLSTGGDDVWDFGTSEQYPALKADIDGDGAATWQEFGHQPR